MADESERDLLLIEAVLYGLWAPADTDPSAEATTLEEDDPLTVNDVIRARRALTRLRSALEGKN